jgi:diketogulonate reductase-like aldo/keto reductase
MFRWKVNNETAADQVVNAIKVGYRLFDGAQDYGNEKVPALQNRHSQCFRKVARASAVQSEKDW